MEGKDLAYWLADKIPACGDYAKQAALVLCKQADEIERLRKGYEQIEAASDSKMRDGDLARDIAAEMLVPNIKVSEGENGK